MPDYLVGGLECRRLGAASDPPNAIQLDILRRTAQLLPPEHLVAVRVVEARAPRQAPTSGGGHNRHERIVRLSAASFGEPHNRQVNQTFLHEMGHLVDAAYGCLRQVQAFARSGPLRADAAALLATPIGPTRHTHGAGEVIADCYQILFRSLRDSSPYHNSVITTQYTGAEAQRRFRVLLATTAFRALTMEQLVELTDDAAFSRLIQRLASA